MGTRGSLVAQLTLGWPAAAAQAAGTVVDTYGHPDEAGDHTLVWHHRGPWKRMVVWRDGARHLFPVPHLDVCEQVVDYHVPARKVSDLLRFDGSVVYERTRGELSARCSGEPANILVLNLAHDLVTGAVDVAGARRRCGEAIRRQAQGEADPYLHELTFQPVPGVHDPDHATVGDTLLHGVAKVFGLTGRSRRPPPTGPDDPSR